MSYRITKRGNKAMIKHTFDNGITTEYKGNRDVKAAWIIVDINDPEGTFISKGYSKSLEAAEKTARGELNWLQPCSKAEKNMYWCKSLGYIPKKQAAQINAAFKASKKILVEAI